ncbi:MAG: DNA cytosine methyltransferase [Lactobacillus sp.]|nr:DNA cytosine methyltransferase [Lactobacillus sp.]
MSDHLYTIDAFFAGVGGIELGFEQTNSFKTIYANEFDKYARETYKINYPDTPLDGRDIHEVKSNEIPKSDLIVGGFPCQAFSIAGYRKGFDDDRGDLFFELLKMIKANKPRVVFIENVKNLVSHDNGNTFKVISEALVTNGYSIKWKVLNSKEFGNIPQNRERIYVVAFRYQNDFEKFEFPGKIKLTTKLSDLIDFDNEKEEVYYYRKNKQPFYEELAKEVTSTNYIYQWRRQYVRKNMSGVVPTLTANMGTGGHNVPIILTNDGQIRKLTPKETFNVQGYPAKFKLAKLSNGRLYKQAGNSVVVPVIKRIAENIANAMKNNDDQLDIDVNKKYALLYTSIFGKMEGQSRVFASANNKEELMNKAENSGLKIISDKEYLKLIQKKKHEVFLMFKEI